MLDEEASGVLLVYFLLDIDLVLVDAGGSMCYGSLASSIPSLRLLMAI